MSSQRDLTAVLDSNVLISLLVFSDPRYPWIAAAWASGSLRVVTDDACAAEFERVLAYPRLKLDAPRQTAIFAEFETRTHRLGAVKDGVDRAGLPKCKDADDQKFLELALAADADLLVTGDRELLKLGDGLDAGRRAGLPFSILTADRLEQRLTGDAASAPSIRK
jgi:uncharacterized protein